MEKLIYGLVTGILFGFFLQKSEMLRYEKHIGAMLLKDFTLFKFMLSAVMVGMVGVYLLKDMGMVNLSVKSTVLGGNIIGGVILGMGWGLLGYCPGTIGGALGEGRWDAAWGMLGMITGGALYAETFPFFKSTLLTWGKFGKVTLPSVLGVNHWILIPLLIVGILMLFKFFEKKNV